MAHFSRYMLAASASAALSLSFAAQSLAAQAPTPVPGLSIPGGSLPYALDHFQGKPELVPVHHSSVEVNNHKGANIAGGAINPFFKQKMTTELAGPHARTVIHDASPSFYLHLGDDPDGGGDTAQSESPVFAVVHATIDKDRRIFAQVKMQALTGSSKRADGIVETTTEKLPGGWLKLTPTAPLAPGEYAITPIPKAQNAFSTVVFDFTADPSAPNATDAVLPTP